MSAPVSQLGADRWALAESGNAKRGYFVEIGAANGSEISNTLMLERDHEWSGLVVEPNPACHDPLLRDRAALVDPRAVWSTTGNQLEFVVDADPLMSGLAAVREGRTEGKPIVVETVSLTDVLRQHYAPREIDFLSLDVEGAELAILSTFDFGAYDIRCMSVEHNHRHDKDEIVELLEGHGYRQVHEEESHWDLWMIRPDLALASALPLPPPPTPEPQMSADRPRTPESTDGLAASLHVEPDAVDRWPDRFYEEAVDHVAGLRLSLPIVCAEILGADPREVSGWPPHRLAAALRDHCVAAPSAPPANEKATEPAALPEAAEVQPPTKDIAHV